MVKSFLIISIFQIFLFAGEQIVLVVAQNMESQRAKLSCFEDNKKVFDSFEVNVGERGLGFGIGHKSLIRVVNEPVKKEGDKKAPIGIFELESVFGYQEQMNIKMPYIYTAKDLICVDEPSSRYYNQIIKMPKDIPGSFEVMKRDDNQYELGVVIAHNKVQLEGAGSCIFMHVQKAKETPTSGCTSMTLEQMQKIVSWLDKSKKPLLIQITKAQLPQVAELYPNLEIEE